jgi:hypothetical protein
MTTSIENYAHCQDCVRQHTRQQLDVGLTATGIKVSCRMHGVVCHFTPETLRDELAKPIPARSFHPAPVPEDRPKGFHAYPPSHPCRRCGCRKDEHRMGSSGSGDDVHSCPTVVKRGLSAPFPRKGEDEPAAEHRERVRAYWTETAYEAMTAE